MPLKWMPHTQHPKKPTTALIATEMGDENPGEYFLVGVLYTWANGQWQDESTGEALCIDTPYFWLSEEDLMATITP